MELREEKTKRNDVEMQLEEEKKVWLIDWKEVLRDKKLSKGAYGEVWSCKYRRKDCVVKILKAGKVFSFRSSTLS